MFGFNKSPETPEEFIQFIEGKLTDIETTITMQDYGVPPNDFKQKKLEGFKGFDIDFGDNDPMAAIRKAIDSRHDSIKTEYHGMTDMELYRLWYQECREIYNELQGKILFYYSMVDSNDSDWNKDEKSRYPL